jgi:hypothetical protein
LHFLNLYLKSPLSWSLDSKALIKVGKEQCWSVPMKQLLYEFTKGDNKLFNIQNRNSLWLILPDSKIIFDLLTNPPKETWLITLKKNLQILHFKFYTFFFPPTNLGPLLIIFFYPDCPYLCVITHLWLPAVSVLLLKTPFCASGNQFSNKLILLTFSQSLPLENPTQKG